MLGNTLTLPQVGGDIVLIKIKEQDYTSEFLKRNTLDEYTAKVIHKKLGSSNPSRVGEYERHSFEVVHRIFAVGDVPQYERKFYFVLEHKVGDVLTNLADAACDLAIATSDAFLVSLQSWES